MNKYDYKQLTIKDITEINNIFREEHDAFDYSRDKKVVQIKFLENEYLTLEEFNKKYKNR